MPASSERGRTIRPVSAGIAFWAGAVIGGWAAVDAYRGGALVGLRWTLIVLLVLWALWIVLWRPRLTVRDDEVTIVNPVRTWTIPWHRVVDVESRLQYVIVTDDERRITAWGSPSPSRPGRPGRQPQAERMQAFIPPQPPPGGVADREQIRVTTDWWVVGIPVVLAAVLVVVLAIPLPVTGV